jgi:hypothetical protein
MCIQFRRCATDFVNYFIILGFATYVSYLGAEAIDPANYPWGRMIIDETFYVSYLWVSSLFSV